MHEEQFQNLLRLLKITGGKYILVEDGEPVAVLMSYEEFADLAVPGVMRQISDRISKIESVNEEITRAQLADLREEVIAEPQLEEASPESITIEPLDLL